MTGQTVVFALFVGVLIGLMLGFLCAVMIFLWTSHRNPQQQSPSQIREKSAPPQHETTEAEAAQATEAPLAAQGSSPAIQAASETYPQPQRPGPPQVPARGVTLQVPPEFQGVVDLSGEFGDVLQRLLTEERSFFITGKAGTGKSTLLKLYVHNSTKNIALLAPTGLAAVNVGGETIHSFFRFPPRPINPDEDITRVKDWALYKAIDTIVIDEVSMVRADLMDAIDHFMRLNGKHPDLPFGGVQLILFGDLYQLPPVVASKEEAAFFSSYYESAFFFDARAFEALDLEKVELTKVFRQRDPEFIRLLDAVRLGRITQEVIERLNDRYLPSFAADQGDGYITLTTTNEIADRINEERLSRLPYRERVYLGHQTGQFERNSMPAPLELKLKPGAQVMFVKNDPDRRWVNGTIGRVREVRERFVRVEIPSPGPPMIVDVGPATWEIHKHRLDHKSGRIITEVVGQYIQIPLKLAWAITIHKSQGLTFDKVLIDLGRGAFAAGQVYVALSRCRTLDGIVLRRRIRSDDVIVHPHVPAFLGDRSAPAGGPRRTGTSPLRPKDITGSQPGRNMEKERRKGTARLDESQTEAASPAEAYTSKKCPHGVRQPYMCAICEPERFRDWTGIG